MPIFQLDYARPIRRPPMRPMTLLTRIVCPIIGCALLVIFCLVMSSFFHVWRSFWSV